VLPKKELEKKLHDAVRRARARLADAEPKSVAPRLEPGEKRAGTGFNE
jgi:hypothetical protein